MKPTYNLNLGLNLARTIIRPSGERRDYLLKYSRLNFSSDDYISKRRDYLLKYYIYYYYYSLLFLYII